MEIVGLDDEYNSTVYAILEDGSKWKLYVLKEYVKKKYTGYGRLAAVSENITFSVRMKSIAENNAIERGHKHSKSKRWERCLTFEELNLNKYRNSLTKLVGLDVSINFKDGFYILSKGETVLYIDPYDKVLEEVNYALYSGEVPSNTASYGD